MPSAFKALVRTTFYECQAPAWSALSYLGDLQTYWTDAATPKRRVAQAGRDLARLNSAYLLRIQQADSTNLELDRLQTLLGLPSLPEWRYVVARVVRRDLDTWWQQIVIQRGELDGIRKGDGVVYRDGVVGRVVEVHSTTCVVELVSSASFRVAAHIDGDLRPVTYVGTPAPVFKSPVGLATNIPADINAVAGQSRRLVTSRLGGAFPDGLTIGFIHKFERESDGLFQRSNVELNSTLVGIEEVSVIVPVLRDKAVANKSGSSK